MSDDIFLVSPVQTHKFDFVSDMVGCLHIQPSLCGEECRPDLRKQQKLSLLSAQFLRLYVHAVHSLFVNVNCHFSVNFGKVFKQKGEPRNLLKDVHDSDQLSWAPSI